MIFLSDVIGAFDYRERACSRSGLIFRSPMYAMDDGRESVEYGFLVPPSTASARDEESVVTAVSNGYSENGPPSAENNNRRSSVALFVYEPKTGRTSTRLFIGRLGERRYSQLSRRERCLCTYSTITTLALAFTLALLLLHGRGVQLLPGLTTMTNVLAPYGKYF